MNNKNIAVIYLVVILNIVTMANGKETANELALTKDGKPNATIVVAAQPSYAALVAAQELQEHIRVISGAVLPLAGDDAPVQGIRILVGESRATRELGLKNSDFLPQEYLIQFMPDKLVLMGRDADSEEGKRAAGKFSQKVYFGDGGVLVPNTNISIRTRGTVKWADGKFGKAMSFEGGGVVVVEACDFPDKCGSMEAWVKLAPDARGDGTILRLDGGKPWTYQIVGTMQRRVAYHVGCDNGKNVKKIESGELADGWHHVLATHSVPDQKMELFVDGKSQGTAEYPVATACRGSGLKIGGIDQGSNVVNAFSGCIDEIRISKGLRSPEVPLTSWIPDADTVLLMHADDGDGVPRQALGFKPLKEPLDIFERQGTCYAVYDFLERFCDARWYGPTDLERVCPSNATLKVGGQTIRRRPAFGYRDPNWVEWAGYPMNTVLWNNPDKVELKRFWNRQRAGGAQFSCNHSFYGYYDRFWKQNPECPEVFEGRHPEYFAQDWPKGYERYGKKAVRTRPPQLCYSHPAVIRQVVQDARDYFDGKGLKKGARARGDIFGLEPMDNAFYCLCPACKAQYHLPENYGHEEKPPPGVGNTRYFAADFSSDYWFGFVNKVAKEIAQSHPGKYLATLAYGAHAAYPGFPLASNVVIQVCLGTRGWHVATPGEGEHELKLYQRWMEDAKATGRPMYLWLYYCFPEETGIYGKFNCFPGFFAHTAAQQVKMFARDGVKGIFFNGLGEQVDTYVSFKLLDDPALEADDLLDEFFSRYYGPAGDPMKKLYLAIEETYGNQKNYPEIMRQHPEWSFAQTEEIAWGYLGTEARMAQFGKLMEEAKAKAQTDIEKQRVALFEKGIWEPMLAGRQKYIVKEVKKREVAREKEARKEELEKKKAIREKDLEMLKTNPPPIPQIHVPRVAAPAAPGDLKSVDWSKGVLLTGWRQVDGASTTRKIEGRIVHDGQYLYIQLQEEIRTAVLETGDKIFNGDDWEIFFAAERNKAPYYQIGITPKEKHYAAYCYVDVNNTADSKKWESGISIHTDRSSADRWVARVAVPLDKLFPSGVKPGDRLFANFYRQAEPNDEIDRELLAWSPNLKGGFHELSRLGELVLE